MRVWDAGSGAAVSVAAETHSMRFNAMASFTSADEQQRIAAAYDDGTIGMLAWRTPAPVQRSPEGQVVQLS